MIEDIANNLVDLKQIFAKIYDGNSHIQEVIPLSKSDIFPLDDKHLEMLHSFAEKKSNLLQFI